jgi:replicative DNA helicase Mcm
MVNVFYGNIGNNKKTRHPTEKYEWMVKPIIQRHSNVGDIILDCFAGCYSNKTQILTKKGWKSFRMLSKNDYVATLDLYNNMYFTKPVAIQRLHYEGNMVRVNHRSVNLLVTPNHNMYLREIHKKSYEFFKADNIPYRFIHTINSIKWEGEEKEWFYLPKIERNSNEIVRERIEMDNFLEFLGWFISDGGTSNKYTAFISQTKKKYLKEIEDLLNVLDLKWRYNGSRFMFSNRQLWEYLEKIGKVYQKHIPEEFMNLSRRQLKILFDSLVKGDGYIKKDGGIIYYTSSKKLADQIQDIIIKLGYNSTLTKRKRKVFKLNRNELEINVRKNKECILDRDKHFTKEYYNGEIYCCTVPYGIICVRKNGRPVWCGNSGNIPAIARKNNRKFIGIEIEKKYFDMSIDRIKKVVPMNLNSFI